MCASTKIDVWIWPSFVMPVKTGSAEVVGTGHPVPAGVTLCSTCTHRHAREDGNPASSTLDTRPCGFDVVVSSHSAISSYKSFHSGFISSMSRSFHARFHFFNCFSS